MRDTVHLSFKKQEVDDFDKIGEKRPFRSTFTAAALGISKAVHSNIRSGFFSPSIFTDLCITRSSLYNFTNDIEYLPYLYKTFCSLLNKALLTFADLKNTNRDVPMFTSNYRDIYTDP